MRNREKITSAGAYLVDRSSYFSGELKSNIDSGEAQLNRHTLFVRKNATNAAATWPMIDSRTQETVGVSSLNGTKLPSNQALVFDKIAIACVEGDAANLEGSLDYVASKVPPVLRNAQLVIVQSGREVINLPVSDLVKTISPSSSEDYYHDLEGFNHLIDNQDITIEFKFPDGTTLAPSSAGKFLYVELKMQGFKTSRRIK